MVSCSARLMAVKHFISFQETLQIAIEDDSFLVGKDRSLYKHLFYGMIRQGHWLIHEVKQRITKSSDRNHRALVSILASGIYQLMWMDKIPKHAVVYETVQLSMAFKLPYKKALINAILRQFQRELEQGYSTAHQELTLRTSHPQWMIDRWMQHHSEATVEQICLSNNVFGTITVRGIPNLSESEWKHRFAIEEIVAEPHPFISGAWMIQSASNLMGSELFRQGLVYVQDAAIQSFLQQTEAFYQGTILDVCGAPGGKSLFLSTLASRPHLVINDVSLRRMKAVVENKTRLNLESLDLVVSDGKALPFLSVFDVVILDVPCSSTGALKKHPELKWTLSEKGILEMAVLQQELLEESSRCLIPGGFMIYSTCSLETEENEEAIEIFLKNHPEFKLIPLKKDSSSDPNGWIAPEGTFKTLPSPHTIGFFGAVLQKKEASITPQTP